MPRRSLCDFRSQRAPELVYSVNYLLTFGIDTARGEDSLERLCSLQFGWGVGVGGTVATVMVLALLQQ